MFSEGNDENMEHMYLDYEEERVRLFFPERPFLNAFFLRSVSTPGEKDELTACAPALHLQLLQSVGDSPPVLHLE